MLIDKVKERGVGAECFVNVIRDHFNKPYVTAQLAHISEICIFTGLQCFIS